MKNLNLSKSLNALLSTNRHQWNLCLSITYSVTFDGGHFDSNFYVVHSKLEMHRRMFTASPQTTICHPQFPVRNSKKMKNMKNMKTWKKCAQQCYGAWKRYYFGGCPFVVNYRGLHATPAMLFCKQDIK